MSSGGLRYFNSQPHKEADRRYPDVERQLRDISTHSLTRRLTGVHHGSRVENNISTHSLTRRLTGFRISLPLTLLHFNSQPHKEADVILPGWQQGSENFNSQPHKEADKSSEVYCLRFPTFQLTASQGG